MVLQQGKIMDPISAKLFLNLCSTLHFGKTATWGDVGAPFLTRTIKKLEEEAGAVLFERDNRHVRLSREGLIFKEFVLNYLEKWNQMKEKLSEEKGGLSGEISIYLSVTASYSVLPLLLEKFRKVYPMVKLKLQTGDAASAISLVSRKEVDFAIAALPDTLKENLDFMILKETPIVFIAEKNMAEKLLKAGPIQFNELPMIMPEYGLARTRVEKWMRRFDIVPQIYARVSGNEAIMGLVRLGCGVGVIPKLVFENSPARGAIKIIASPSEIEPYRVGLAADIGRLERAVNRAFWNLALSQLEDSKSSSTI